MQWSRLCKKREEATPNSSFLILNWEQDKKSSSIEEARASFFEIRTNDLMRDFLWIDLVKSSISYTRKRNDLSDSGLIPDNESGHTNINPFSSTFFYLSLLYSNSFFTLCLNKYNFLSFYRQFLFKSLAKIFIWYLILWFCITFYFFYHFLKF